jgi:hypothetical protein
MDESAFGGESIPGTMAGGNTEFGSALAFGGEGQAMGGADVPSPIAAPANAPPAPIAPREPERTSNDGFGASLKSILPGPNYNRPDPAMSALDQSANMLEQRVKRANEVAANPLLQFFNPEGVTKAREFIPQAAEQLQKIRTQQAAIKAGKQQAETLGLQPGDVPDEASMADRVEVAKARALKGDLRVFKGLQAVDPKAAESIVDQVQEVAAGHLTKAQYAFDKLSNTTNQGEYQGALNQLRREGALQGLEALGLKVPGSIAEFGKVKATEGQALREARMGVDAVRAKLEERNTYQPMEEKEAKTYAGRLTTAFGDQISNGTWGRNASSNARGLIVNGAADPRDLGKKYTLATPEQRKAIREEAEGVVPKAELEKARAFDRTLELAIPTPEQVKRGDKINTNPNVQQAIAEQLASMLRGGTGGANVGLLQIETSKRGAVQGLLDNIIAGYAGGINTITGKDVRGYMSKLTQDQIREVLDGIKEHNDELLNDRVAPIAKRAGALGLDTTAFGWGKDEAAGVIGQAIEAGRLEQIERLMPFHQSIGGGDGVFQLGAQRPGAGAVSSPPGTAPTTQIPGAPPVATPVQQASGPNPAGAGVPPVTPPSGGAAPPAGVPATSPTVGPAPAGGSPAAPGTPTPVRVAGLDLNVALPPGASPDYVNKMQRIESGREKDPWKAVPPKNPDGTRMSSASGAFQFIKSTWAANKPPGAPDSAKDATPQQQAEALVKFTAQNAKALAGAKLPVNDTTLYIAHNLGSGGASQLLSAPPTADAKEIVGADAARNNPKFFRGKPTVATVLQRYAEEMDKGGAPDDGGPKPQPGAGGATAEAPSLLARLNRALMSGVKGTDEKGGVTVEEAAAESRKVGAAATENAPAIGSTLGAAVGSVAGPFGTVAGGAAGGSAGQSLKDYLQGRDQSPKDIVKEGALGGVLGVTVAGRPLVSAAVRAAGAGGVEAGAKAAEGGDAADVLEAGGKGTALAAGGEAFGRALGMVGHKVFNMFAPEAKQAVRTAAGKYADAEDVLAKELPKIQGAEGASMPNPKYEAAEQAKTQAEKVLKDAGLKPEEAAYAHKVATEGNVPKNEAVAAKPGAVEKAEVTAGMNQLTKEIGEKGVGALKAAAKLPDGPRAAVEAKRVSKDHEELAERVEMAITAPAPDWGTKWKQLVEARSDLLKAERDALASTVPGKTRTAKDMRELADTVRVQQEKAAKYVFGEQDGAAFMKRLNVLDKRYAILMEATGGTVDGITKAAKLTGEAGRAADRKFKAFAHDDPTAIAAWEALRGQPGTLSKVLGFAQHIPIVEKAVPEKLVEYLRNRAAGSPAKFADFVKQDPAFAQMLRDAVGGAVQRGVTM